jgi:flagellar hook-length control protein FliK
MVNAKFSSGAQKAQQTSQNGTGFDMLLAQAERKQTFETTQDNSSERNRGRNNSNEPPRREVTPVRREETRNEDVTGTSGTAAVQEQTANEYVCNEPVQIDETEAVEKIAEVLQVPVDEVMEILQEAEIVVQDLTETQNVAKILQIALEAETPAELLNDPEFPELYKEVNEAVAQLVAKAAPKAVANEGSATVIASDETVNILAEELEGAEVTVEDGEVVVTNETRAVNPQTKPQTSNAQTQTSAEQPQISEASPEATEANLLNANENAAQEVQTAIQTVNLEAAAAKIESTVQQNAPQSPVNTTDVIQQIMNQVKVVNTGGQFTEMRMTLRPETLGDIVLRVITQNGIVMAQFEAESQRVKEALEADFNLLRDALAESGIKFSELSVSVRQDENERLNQFERERQRSRNRAETIENVQEEEVSYHNGVIDLTA